MVMPRRAGEYHICLNKAIPIYIKRKGKHVFIKT